MAGSQTVNHFQKLDDLCSESLLSLTEARIKDADQSGQGEILRLPSNYQSVPRNIPRGGKTTAASTDHLQEPRSISETHRTNMLIYYYYYYYYSKCIWITSWTDVSIDVADKQPYWLLHKGHSFNALSLKDMSTIFSTVYASYNRRLFLLMSPHPSLQCQLKFPKRDWSKVWTVQTMQNSDAIVQGSHHGVWQLNSHIQKGILPLLQE
jgi:hypothetical protein